MTTYFVSISCKKFTWTVGTVSEEWQYFITSLKPSQNFLRKHVLFTALFKGHPISWIPFFTLFAIPPAIIKPQPVKLQDLNVSSHFIPKNHQIWSSVFSFSVIPDTTRKFVERRFKRGDRGGPEGEVLVGGELGWQVFGFTAEPRSRQPVPGRALGGAPGCSGIQRDAAGCGAP